MSQSLVYLIDDDEIFAKTIELRFLKFGIEFKFFKTPDALYHQLAIKIPQLVLVDINLEDGVLGYEVVKKLRKDIPQKMAIVMFSAEEDQRKVAHALEIGADDYIVKNAIRYDFEDVIARYVKAKNLARPDLPTFLAVNRDKERAKLSFAGLIEEVGPNNLVLLSDHLVKKGTSFYLQGDQLKTIFSNSSRVFVNVMATATKQVEGQKKYQLFLEVDESQTGPLEELRDFLKSRFAERFKS